MYAARLVLGTSRGLRIFGANALAAFGLTSAFVQFIGQLFPAAIQRPGLVTLVALALCALWGIGRAYPRQSLRKEFQHPDISISVVVGDLFEQPGHLVVGFSDTFDTSTADGQVISPASIQGQLINRRYDGDRQRLDRELDRSLSGVVPIAREHRRDKRFGKLRRYEIGTVAVVGTPDQLVFAVAYSRMDNDLVAHSTVDGIWLSLGRIWESVYHHAPHSRVVIPLVGSGLARVDQLERHNLLRMILLSFLARSRMGVVCRELRIVIWPPDLDKIDLLEVDAFLRTL